ncbi:MAG: hypothetical protein K1V96_07290 [Lachnospiraceae bacterium]
MKQSEDITEKKPEVPEKKQQKHAPLNETWSQDAQDELEAFIEQQGIYIRQ